ncbi:MAG: tRNA pseudouridine(55) synthase TruB [Clostridia bacterium]|nr:tRNA pseudouridine(55) synthase TruB [Clostridia bacterium]
MKGIINLHKEPGMSSHAVVAAVRKITGEKKTGHPGTLDPMASGVLPILVGGATRCSDRFLDMEKTYVGTARFGLTSDTQDVWGNIISRQAPEAVKVAEEQVREALKAFSGDILQRPPAFSALKKDGKPLYKLARKGIQIEIDERPVKVYEAGLIRFFREEGYPAAEIRITCGRGTYIRTIINDLGEALGAGAVMSALKRVSYGGFRLENSFTLGDLAALAEEGRLDEAVSPIETVFPGEPEVNLSERAKLSYMQGKNVILPRSAISGGACDTQDGIGELVGKNREVLVKSGGVLFATAKLAAAVDIDGNARLSADGSPMVRLVPERYFGE